MIKNNIKTNAVCRNPSCRANFVSCSYCTKAQSWRSVCCSLDCYNTYAQLVDEALAKNKNLNMVEAFRPQRTDMSEAEVVKIQMGTHEEAAEIAKRELTDMGYGEELNELGIGATIDKINAEIRESRSLDNANCVADEEKVDNEHSDDDVAVEKPTTRRSRKSKYNQ